MMKEERMEEVRAGNSAGLPKR